MLLISFRNCYYYYHYNYYYFVQCFCFRQKEQLTYVRKKHLAAKEKRVATQHVKWKFYKSWGADKELYGLPDYNVSLYGMISKNCFEKHESFNHYRVSV